MRNCRVENVSNENANGTSTDDQDNGLAMITNQLTSFEGIELGDSEGLDDGFNHRFSGESQSHVSETILRGCT